eukprot:UC1_evm1s1202
MSDAHFSAVHGNPRLLDLVDDEWRADRLPKDEVKVPPQHDVPVDDGEEVSPAAQQDMEKKWTELGISDFK